MNTPFPSARGLWQLLWRSAVFLPFALVLTTLWLSFWMAIIILPVAAIAFALDSLWLNAALCFVAWLPLLCFTRWKRLYIDRKDALNEYENV